MPAAEALVDTGVSYGSALSEAPALQGEHAVVVGAGNSAGQAASHLARFARRVTLVAPRAGSEQPSTRWGTILGRVWFPWVVAGYGPYRPENIASYFASVEPTYPPEVEQALEELHGETERRAAAGEEVEGDADGYKLVRFHVSSRVGELEEPRLILHFRPTTRYLAW